MLELQVTYANPTATPAHYPAALNRQGTLGLADGDLPPELLAMVSEAKARLRDEYGYQIVPPAGPEARPHTATSVRTPSYSSAA
jgi:hypothetical protein